MIYNLEVFLNDLKNPDAFCKTGYQIKTWNRLRQVCLLLSMYGRKKNCDKVLSQFFEQKRLNKIESEINKLRNELGNIVEMTWRIITNFNLVERSMGSKTFLTQLKIFETPMAYKVEPYKREELLQKLETAPTSAILEEYFILVGNSIKRVSFIESMEKMLESPFLVADFRTPILYICEDLKRNKWEYIPISKMKDYDSILTVVLEAFLNINTNEWNLLDDFSDGYMGYINHLEKEMKSIKEIKPMELSDLSSFETYHRKLKPYQKVKAPIVIFQLVYLLDKRFRKILFDKDIFIRFLVERKGNNILTLSNNSVSKGDFSNKKFVEFKRFYSSLNKPIKILSILLLLKYEYRHIKKHSEDSPLNYDKVNWNEMFNNKEDYISFLEDKLIKEAEKAVRFLLKSC